ncbi:fasciclin domain-containing protein [Rhodohalobacter sp.]|uniref:fasciclin domain-containing protein n=1 Tax=Rhodohalobacter sp. TaxID=1974210 RepID=UPI002ACD434A|nr:fasciclin domain-containing protein [Rhodohalobacter sp.]MDZ7756480.1 fasciclin domain-containing protein [Rhodohalobacter sp.]
MKRIIMISTLVLATFFIAMAPYSISTQNDDNHDIVSIAQDTDNLSTLVAAIEAAGLVDVLKGDGPFTVFAPTNAAFEALPDGTLESLLMPENRDQLVKILTYHVISGEVMSGDLSNGMKAGTVEGSEVTITLGDFGVRVNGANVEAADIDASNGVIHVIDAVILPPQDNSGY